MKRKSLFPVAMLLFTFCIMSCGPSPESAAEKVCACISESIQSAGLSQASEKTIECREMGEKYSEKFEGEDLAKFQSKVASCATGKLFGN